jgi:hypothetical protein
MMGGLRRSEQANEGFAQGTVIYEL